MINWPTKKLGEVCEKLNLIKAPISSWPYIEIGDINIENKIVVLKDKKSIKGAIIAPGDSVLVSRVRPTRGAIAYIDKDYAVSLAFSILKPKSSESFSKFLFYWLVFSKNFFQYLQKKQKGSNYPSVRDKDILNFKIYIPPLKIQQKIMERLDAIKKAQELNDKQIELAEELYRSLLHRELNSKFKIQKSKLQFKIKKLREVIAINYGKGLSKSDRKEDGKYFAYGSNGPVYKTNKILVNYPTIIIGRKGAAGALYLVKEPNWPIDTTFYVEIKDKNELNLDFLYFLLQTMNLQYLAIVTAVPGINRDNLYNLKIPFPPIETQRKIVEKLSAVQDYKKKLLEQKQKLNELFESVLHKSMKGELVR
jgi:type I restriction enzyme S subunit